MTARLVLLLASTLLPSAANAGWDPFGDLQTAWKAADLSDGVDATEARALATAYGATLVSGCGGPLPAEDAGDHWTVGLLVGIGATEGPTLRIHKTSGTVSSDGLPTVSAHKDGVRVRVKADATPDATDPFSQAAAGFAAVDLSDGLDEAEARTVGSAYSNALISGCGGVHQVTRAGDHFEATTLIGRGAEPGPTVRLHATTGATTTDGRPTATPEGEHVVFTP